MINGLSVAFKKDLTPTLHNLCNLYSVPVPSLLATGSCHDTHNNRSPLGDHESLVTPLHFQHNELGPFPLTWKFSLVGGDLSKPLALRNRRQLVQQLLTTVKSSPRFLCKACPIGWCNTKSFFETTIQGFNSSYFRTECP